MKFKTHYLIYICLIIVQSVSGQDNLVQQYKKFRNAPVNSLLVDKDNIVWAGTEDGLYKLQNFNIDEEIIFKHSVSTLSLDKSGNGWVGLYSNKLTLTADNQIFSTGISKKDVIRSIGVIEKAVWIGTRNGLYKLSLFSEGETKHYTTINSNLESNRINKILIDNEGKRWVATEKGITTYNGAKWENHLSGINITALAIHRNTIWAAGEGKLWRYENQSWSPITLKADLAKHAIQDLIFDGSGHLWMASKVVAKYNVREGIFSIFDAQSGFTSSQALCLAVDYDNHIWVGTAGKGLFKIENDPPETPLAFVAASSSTLDPEQNQAKGVSLADKGEMPKAEPVTISKKKIATKKKSEKSKKSKRSKRSRKSKKQGEGIKSNINFLGRRLIKEGQDVAVRDNYIEIAVWDGQDVDGDTVSLYFNGECILKNFNLSSEPQYFNIDINPKGYNHLVLYAHSQGKLGFATATVAVTGDRAPKEWIVLNADKQKCDKINFIFQR